MKTLQLSDPVFRLQQGRRLHMARAALRDKVEHSHTFEAMNKEIVGLVHMLMYLQQPMLVFGNITRVPVCTAHSDAMLPSQFTLMLQCLSAKRVVSQVHQQLIVKSRHMQNLAMQVHCLMVSKKGSSSGTHKCQGALLCEHHACICRNQAFLLVLCTTVFGSHVGPQCCKQLSARTLIHVNAQHHDVTTFLWYSCWHN